MTSLLASDLINADLPWRRLSRRMLLVHPVTEVGRAIPALAGLFFAGSSSGGGSMWSLIGAVAVIGHSLTRWFTTSYRVTDGQIQLRRGLLRRTTIAAPLDRVRTVDVTAHLLHRALGLSKVVIGTGTSDRKGRGGLVLDGLGVAAAADLRGELLHRAGPPTSGTSRAVTPQSFGVRTAGASASERELARLDLSWIRYAPFTLSGAITSVAVLGFGWRLDNEAHINVSHLGPLRALGADLRRTSLLLDVAAISVLVAIIVSLASTIGYVLAFWRFRLTRHDGGSLHVSRGLITSRATSIERRRLVGVEISEPLLLRLVRGSRCAAVATGLRVGRGAERGGEVLLPPAPRSVVAGVVSEVLGSATAGTHPLPRHPKAALHRRFVRTVAGAVTVALVDGILVAFTGFATYSWVACVAVVGLALPLATDRYRGLGHALVDGYVVLQLGSLLRRRTAIRAGDVIGWNFSSSLFQRHVGLTTLTATTAAGRQGYQAIDVADGEAVAFAERATPGLILQFVSL